MLDELRDKKQSYLLYIECFFSCEKMADDDVYFHSSQYYLQDTHHSNYLQLLSIIKEFKEL